MTDSPIVAFAFDLDGTLIDLEPLHHAAHLEAAREVGVYLTWQQAFERINWFVGGPDERVSLEIANLSRHPVSPVDLLRSKQDHFWRLASDTGTIQPRAGVRDVLQFARDRRIPLTVGTVTERSLALHLLERAGLLPLFGAEMTVTGCDVRALKPAPDVYLETARRLSVRPADQLVFEDSVTGLSAARSSGSRAIAVPTVRRPEYLRRIADSGPEAVMAGWSDPALRPLLERLLAPGDRGGSSVA